MTHTLDIYLRLILVNGTVFTATDFLLCMSSQ